MRQADGVYHWMLHQKLPGATSTEQIVKWYGSSIDIEESEQAEDSLLSITTKSRSLG